MRKRRRLLAVGVLLLAPVLWFAGVVWHWDMEHCELCGYRRDISRYAVFGITVSESAIEYRKLAQSMAEDLGVPCKHIGMEHAVRQRRWGLVICACPCDNGIMDVTNSGDGYDAQMAALLRDRAQALPSLPAEFYERVIVGHDWRYMNSLFDDLKAETEVGEPE